MRKFLAAAAIAVMTMSMLTGCGSKQADTSNENVETVTIKHSKGEAQVPTDVKKAVVFELSVLDTIDALGVDVELGLPSNLPEYLKGYEETATNVGSMKEANVEAIYDFAPDVIFISGRLESYYDELSKIAPTIYVSLNAETYMDDVKESINNVATIFGKTEEANAKLAELDQKAEEAKTLANASDEKALILLANEGSLSVYGKGSRYGFMHDSLEVKCADENIAVSTHGQDASYEYISETNPDIIFVIDRSAAVGGSVYAKDTLNNDLVNGTNAAKNNKMVYLDSTLWYLSGGGLNSTTVQIDEVIAALK
ncbi:MAG: ABC transporter substrate-binding protein [bacterium]|nr:ABC transporter substrate-binding protein [bacterium]